MEEWLFSNKVASSYHFFGQTIHGQDSSHLDYSMYSINGATKDFATMFEAAFPNCVVIENEG
jgi:hypothetical protein